MNAWQKSSERQGEQKREGGGEEKGRKGRQTRRMNLGTIEVQIRNTPTVNFEQNIFCEDLYACVYV